MSRKILKTYQNFSRIILKEFMTYPELDELDKKYRKAKIDRTIRRMNEGKNY